MKSKVALLLALAAAITLGALCIYQSRRISTGKAQISSLSHAVERAGDEVHELQVSKDHLNARRQELEQQARLQLGQSNSWTAATAATPSTRAPLDQPVKPDAPAAGFGNMLAKMMQDPDTRKFMREQQRLVLDQLYNPLVKQMGLTAEEGDRFKDLLAENTMRGTEKASSLFGGGQTGTNRTEALATIASEHKAGEDQIKELLGDDRYAQYKDYQQTAGERMQLNLFKQQLGGASALTDQQTDQLLALMQEEKRATAASGQPVPGVDSGPGQLEATLDQDKTDALLATQEDVNQRVFERARAVLTPEQLAPFGKFQTNQLQMMRMGMSMARKLLGPSDVPAAPAP